jgi:hypothetical protein
MDNFKTLVTAIDFGELANTIRKIAKFGFAKSADLFSNLEFLDKMPCNKTFGSVNKICRHTKHLVKIRKSKGDISHEDRHVSLYTYRHKLLNVRHRKKCFLKV